MTLSKASALMGACGLSCFALLALPAQAQMSTEHQLGVLGTGDSQLDTGGYFDTYELEGYEGQRVSISLDSSDFDAYLGLFDSDGNMIVTNDNATEENINSYLSATLPHTGTYTVVATAQDAQSGDYRLALRSFAPPQSISTASSGDSNSSGGLWLALLSNPLVQGMIVDAFSSGFSGGGSSGASYDHYYGSSTGSSASSYGGSSAPAVGGFYGNGPQHGTRPAW